MGGVTVAHATTHERKEEMNPFLHNVRIIKTLPRFFREVAEGRKRFEWRKNDRNYKVGDYLILREYYVDSDKYSGRNIVATVSYILDSGFDLPDGYCVMSIKVISKPQESANEH